MAKKSFGKFLALATITGAVAAGVSYFLKYRSFHAELEDDFHDFEDDGFDGTLPHEGESSPRNYVSLGEKKGEAMEAVEDAAAATAEKAAETAGQAAEKVEGAAREVKEHAAEAAGTAKDMTTTIEEDTQA